MCKDGMVAKRITDHDPDRRTITIHSPTEMYRDGVISQAEAREIFNVVQMMRKPTLQTPFNTARYYFYT